MRLHLYLAVAIGLSIQGTVCTDEDDPLRELYDRAIENLKKQEVASQQTSGQCSISTAERRKDWDTLTSDEKADYIQAVQCLFDLPTRSDKSWAAGARTRYDDWPAIHINQTAYIHRTGNFLTYHRYLTWTYEQALREDCGYKGVQPYWNWFKYQSDVTKNPLMDGSDLSMGGNGAFFEHNGTLAAGGLVYMPSGVGGGCIESGPFANQQISLGPIAPAMRGMSAPVSNTNAYNPRCLRRDLNSYAASKWHTWENLLNITTGEASHSIAAFQTEFQGRPPDGFLGLHSGGHHTIGGDNSDNYSSATDPLFFFHHAMVDFVYWLWQALHSEMAGDISGWRIPQNDSLGTSLTTDRLEVGATGSSEVTVGDMLDTLGGSPACYIYEY
jgi:tyrosinase